MSKKVITKVHKDEKGSKVYKVAKYSGATLSTLLAAGIAFSCLPGQAKFTAKYYANSLGVTEIEKPKNEDYSFDYVIQAIQANENLSDEEKELTANILESEINENKDYIDLNRTINRLKTLKIIHVPEKTYNQETGEEIDNSDYKSDIRR